MSSQVNAYSAGLVADGTVNSILTVPNSDRFAIGAVVTVQDTTTATPTVCKVASKAGLNRLVVSTIAGNPIDVSRWQVANGAYVTQTSQVVSGTIPPEGTESKIITGFMLVAPNSVSTQATGTGDTVGNVGFDKGIVVINGTVLEAAASGGSDVTATWGTGTTDNIANGSSAVGTVYCYNNAGTLTFAMAKGVAATTGTQVALTDAAIIAAASLTAANGYVRVGNVTFNRTGATTVTQSQSNLSRWF